MVDLHLDARISWAELATKPPKHASVAGQDNRDQSAVSGYSEPLFQRVDWLWNMLENVRRDNLIKRITWKRKGGSIHNREFYQPVHS